MSDLGYGLCRCGCGERTTISPKTRTAKGWVKGEPRFFVKGHNGRGTGVWNITKADRGHATPCHIWQGAKCPHGYGRVNIENRTRQAHRVAYERGVGPIPEGLVIDHLCRVPSCVNPDHLEAVTHWENLRRGNSTKLTKQQALAIREDTRAAPEIAAEHGIQPAAVHAIRHGRAWINDMEVAA